MKAWKTLDRERTADGSELVLQERDGEFVVRVDGHELMSSRQHGSEEAMALHAAGAWKNQRAPQVLVGGLGLGFTLRAVLNQLPKDGKVCVAELSSAIVRWNRDTLAPLAGRPLEDPRVEIKEQDVAKVLQQSPGKFHAVLLDVDNGPSALVAQSNSALYSERGLKWCRKALVPQGVLVVWSASPDAAYLTRLQREGFRAQALSVSSRPGARGRHVLFVAQVA